ncbi:Lreu_0056 family protein [Companilactobacillus sp.]|jgi:hypothetical protein|uniref:Lreu_0056 family protein n=1 Tax=Companilactobacillus sp. TaxID=2767905 RepID=UPI0034126E33
MKIRGLSLITLFATGVLLLSGCGNHNSNSSSSPQTKTSVSKSSKSSSDKDSKALWNDSKDAQLKKFIDDWAPTMHQSYQKFDGEHTIKTSTGMVYPDDLTKVSVDGSNSSIGWSKSGKGHYAYNVVAIYNYNGSPNHITYFFAFHDGQPVALVDQSSGGTPDLTPTKNNDVQSTFESIAGGSSASSSSSASANNSNENTGSSEKKNSSDSVVTDNDTIAVMVYEKGFNVEDDLANIPITIGVNKEMGRYVLGSGGTGATTMTYSASGSTITYWTNDYENRNSTGGPGEKEHTTTVQELQREFYATSSQKQAVNDAASRIKHMSDF